MTEMKYESGSNVIKVNMELMQKIFEKNLQSSDRKQSNRTPEQDTIEIGKHLVPVSQIVYEQTQVIEVDKQTLVNNRVVAADDDDPRADMFRILRTKVIQKIRGQNQNVIAITSPSAGVGKSLMAVNLAVSIAKDSNYSVILVDMDLRRPSVHRYFGIKPTFGLSNYCLDDKPIDELLINPGIKSLVILPAGKPTRRSSDLLSSSKMMAFADELKYRYPNRIVILDLPPLLLTDDALTFLPNVDACLLVAAEGQTTKEEMERCLSLIEPRKFMGTILNKSDDMKDSYYY